VQPSLRLAQEAMTRYEIANKRNKSQSKDHEHQMALTGKQTRIKGSAGLVQVGKENSIRVIRRSKSGRKVSGLGIFIASLQKKLPRRFAAWLVDVTFGAILNNLRVHQRPRNGKYSGRHGGPNSRINVAHRRTRRDPPVS